MTAAPVETPRPAAAAPAETSAAAAPEPETEAPPAARAEPALIDDQARRLAEFFNGEVVQLDGPLPELDSPAA
jgi:DNA polymerase-3 subunit gamma/tau